MGESLRDSQSRVSERRVHVPARPDTRGKSDSRRKPVHVNRRREGRGASRQFPGPLPPRSQPLSCLSPSTTKTRTASPCRAVSTRRGSRTGPHGGRGGPRAGAGKITHSRPGSRPAGTHLTPQSRTAGSSEQPEHQVRTAFEQSTAATWPRACSGAARVSKHVTAPLAGSLANR